MLDKDSFAIFLVGVVIFTIGLSPEFIGFDCRFAVFAQEMFRNGPTFFPTTYGQPYPDYPGTSTFMIYLVSLPFGKVTPFTAILPTGLVSALILVVIYRIGAMQSRKWGFSAVLLALFTKEFLGLSRSISIDQYTTLATALCFYIAYSSTVYNKQKRLIYIPFLLIASFAFRGPIGLVIPAGVICVYHLYKREYKKFALMASLSAILLAICSLLLVAAAKHQGGDEFVKKVIEMQVTGRINGNARHWIGYYFTESFARYFISFIFAVIVFIVLFKKIFKRENDEYRFLSVLVVWILVVLIGMSIPSTKKIRYVLPMIPAVALVASYMFINQIQDGILFNIKRKFLQFCSWFPLGTVVVITLWAINGKIVFLSKIHFLTVILITIILAIAAWVLSLRLKDSKSKDLVLMAIGVATFIVIIVGVNEPINYYNNSTKPFVTEVENLRSQEHGELVFYKIGSDSEAIKFMTNLDKPAKPQFINISDDILKHQIPAYFIAMKSDFEELPKSVKQQIKQVGMGKIGKDDCILFICQLK